ncbi:MAG: SMI1/KNR4 family protein [Sulfitobacter sp.]
MIASLRPPLSIDQIASLEDEYQLVLPDAVKTLYLWHDGQDPSGFTTFVNNMAFQPLSEALRAKAELDGMIGYDFDLENWWHPAWLPLFHSGGGDYIVVDLVGIHTGNRNQLLKVYHDWAYRPIVAEDLQTFLDAALVYYGTKSIEEMDEFHIIDEFLPPLEQSFNASGMVKPLK